MSERTQSQGRLPGAWTLTRDVLSFLGGWVLIFLEVARPEIRESVLVLAAGAVGLPSAVIGLQSVQDVLAARRSGTGDSSSQPPEPAESPSPQSSR